MGTPEHLFRYYRVDFPDGTKAFHRSSVDFACAAAGRLLGSAPGSWQPLGYYSRRDLAEERIKDWLRVFGGRPGAAETRVLPLVEVEKPARKRVIVKLPNRRELTHYYCPEWGLPRPVAVLVERPGGLDPSPTWLMKVDRQYPEGPDLLLIQIPPEKVLATV